MKYYYISYDGPFRNYLITGKDVNRILSDKDKIIVTKINGRFHVLLCKNGNFEKEKYVFSYSELIKFLRKSFLNTYFVNVGGEVASRIHSDVKKIDDYGKDNIDEVPKAFFTIDNSDLIKVEAFVNRDIIKEKLDQVYNEEIKDEKNVQVLDLKDFVENSELFELCHYPINEKNGKFTVLKYGYANPSLYYILSGIYNKYGNNISLDSDDLSNLYIGKAINEDVVNDIVFKIDVNVLAKYNLDDFSKSIEFIDLYKKQEKDLQIQLLSTRNCLKEAKKNSKYVNNLGILRKEYTKDNTLRKNNK